MIVHVYIRELRSLYSPCFCHLYLHLFLLKTCFYEKVGVLARELTREFVLEFGLDPEPFRGPGATSDPSARIPSKLVSF